MRVTWERGWARAGAMLGVVASKPLGWSTIAERLMGAHRVANVLTCPECGGRLQFDRDDQRPRYLSSERQSAPAANRTRTTGSGDLCDILFTTGA